MYSLSTRAGFVFVAGEGEIIGTRKRNVSFSVTPGYLVVMLYI